mgnify:CR=1 FL=1
MFIEKNNFLPTQEFETTFGTLRNNTSFPWYYSKNTAYDDLRPGEQEYNLWDFSFSNTLYIDGAPTSFVGEEGAKLLEKICNHSNLKLKEIIRIRAGLITRTPYHITHNAHVDYIFPHHTALFYITSCNGPTIMYNQKYPNDTILTEQAKIMPEENKIVVFDGLQYHSSTSQTDTKQRIVINFNFKVEE